MQKRVIVRGGGDIASGTIYKLFKCGFEVLVLETSTPSAIRRKVAFSEAVYDGQHTVEDVTCYLANSLDEAMNLLEEKKLVMLVDPEGHSIQAYRPDVVVDAILAKHNLGTTRNMAPLTIGLGPGFVAGCDVDVVIETMRGHRLGRVIEQGSALKNTGIPAIIGGYGIDRVVRSPGKGRLHSLYRIGDYVQQGDIIAIVEQEHESYQVKASISGILRGMIREGYQVNQGEKIADIDARVEERENCFTISEKARCIAGGVLEAILSRQESKHHQSR